MHNGQQTEDDGGEEAVQDANDSKYMYTWTTLMSVDYGYIFATSMDQFLQVTDERVLRIASKHHSSLTHFL